MKQAIKPTTIFEQFVVTREQAIKDPENGRLGGLTEWPGNLSKFKIALTEQSKMPNAANRRDHCKIGAEILLSRSAPNQSARVRPTPRP